MQKTKRLSGQESKRVNRFHPGCAHWFNSAWNVAYGAQLMEIPNVMTISLARRLET